MFNFVEEEKCIVEVVAPEQLQKCKILHPKISMHILQSVF